MNKVSTLACADHVVIFVRTDAVVTSATDNDVIPCACDDHVGAVGAHDAIGSRRAHDRGCTTEARLTFRIPRTDPQDREGTGDQDDHDGAVDSHVVSSENLT
jgi:hypothetical protein